MQYPPDEVMEAFHAMSQAVGIDHETGPLLAYIPDRAAPDGCRTHEITGEAIDELVARGWVELVGDDEIEATDRGVYWLKRWCALKDRANKPRRTGR